jgi:hypothetical protein
MRSRGVRVLLLVAAAAALAAAGTGVWQIEGRISAAQGAADDFERGAREAVVSLGDWRAAQQACVAEGQPPAAWMTKAAGIAEAVGPKLSALRAAAGTAEAQGAVESAIEAFTAAVQSDARARDYVSAGQRLSASDVIFLEAAPAIEKAVINIDTARGQERVAFAVALEALRRWELIALGGAAAVLLLVVLLLVPLPRTAEGAEGAEGPDEVVIPRGAGLNLSSALDDGVVRRAQPIDDAAAAPAAARPGPVLAATSLPAASAPADDDLGTIDFDLDEPVVARAPSSAAKAPSPAVKAPDLEAVADLCSSMARVQDTRELQGLLERTARALDASGIIVWMPDGPQGVLRPVLTYGYASLTLTRMGIIHPAADNATAAAYRTRSVVAVPSEVLSRGAVVAPLIGAEGCSGAMAVELREGVEPTPQVRALATIVAAQLATMFTPGSVTSAPPATLGEAAGADVAAGQG